MNKLIALKVWHLRLDDVEGLVAETITVATTQPAVLGPVASAKYLTLVAKNNEFRALLNKSYASLLTPQIKEKDRLRDSFLSEIKRTAKTAAGSSIPATAAAGAKLMEFLTPFWNIDKEPMMSQTAQLFLLDERLSADPVALAAVDTLGLQPVIQSLSLANLELKNLYDERLNDTANTDGPSASSLKSEVVTAYDEFCGSVEITLSAIPTDAVQHIFNEMNDIRRKYISRIPVPLSESHTSAAPIAPQVRNGRHLTPIPRVFFNRDGKLDELVFAQDFTVTYRNNVEVGEAKIFIHGKGKYTGTYTTSFHIVAEQ
ncbi:MAG: DUF6261 family protein [Tannerella sp.]|jgi:hypothetical protein|nr:DUF6261 family protein [Tannerella sp.]